MDWMWFYVGGSSCLQSSHCSLASSKLVSEYVVSFRIWDFMYVIYIVKEHNLWPPNMFLAYSQLWIMKIHRQPTTNFSEGKRTRFQLLLFWRAHSSLSMTCFHSRWDKASLVVLWIVRGKGRKTNIMRWRQPKINQSDIMSGRLQVEHVVLENVKGRSKTRRGDKGGGIKVELEVGLSERCKMLLTMISS